MVRTIAYRGCIYCSEIITVNTPASFRACQFKHQNLITWCYERAVFEIGRCTGDKLSLPELTSGKMKTIKQQGISLVKYFISYTSRQYDLSSCSSCCPDFQSITFGPPPCIFRALTVPTIIAH